MKDIIDTLKKVRDRIQNYQEELQNNEMLTRYVLIDPVLRALGWDTEESNKVVPEINVFQGRPDYSLICDQKILVMIEAKALGTDIDKFNEAGFKYCWHNKVPFGNY
ncbi:MAG: hypothetical protein NZ927_00980 [Candidatus Calescibacterium sp.]|nr:hypothetical protein [Candidatus Calescibacterium sp.]MCX7733714.1 hypothetical protein [bacterium]MDW8087502.1 hypothetical protein [Candidatus Calescibacterium sp.]